MNPGRLGRIVRRKFSQGQRIARNRRRAVRANARATRRAVRRTGCLTRLLFW